jgi:hypothetical protein
MLDCDFFSEVSDDTFDHQQKAQESTGIEDEL